MKLIPLLYLPREFQRRPSADPASVSERVTFGGEFSSPAELALFRWIVGHQTLALAMKLAIFEMRSLTGVESSAAREEKARRILGYTEGFTSLLHYTVSWTPETYLQSLRPTMIATHPSFSGLWWSEVSEFKELLNNLLDACPAESRAIGASYGAFWQQHSVLKRYLPVESSLYRDGLHLLTPDFDYSDYFDLYFKIVRKDGCEDIFLDQLNTRVRLITEDVTIHGLFVDSPLRPLDPKTFLAQQETLRLEAERTVADLPRTSPVKAVTPDHLAIQVRDVNQTISWYEAFFDGRVSWRMDGGFSETTTSRLPSIRSLVELRVGTVTFHIFDSDVADRCPAKIKHPNYQHFGIVVPTSRELHDMRARWFALKDTTGAFPADGSGATEIITENDGTELFYCTDPNGLEFEIIYRPTI